MGSTIRLDFPTTRRRWTRPPFLHDLTTVWSQIVSDRSDSQSSSSPDQFRTARNLSLPTIMPNDGRNEIILLLLLWNIDRCRRPLGSMAMG